MSNLQDKGTVRRNQFTAFALLFNTISWFFIGRLVILRIGDAFSDTSLLQLVYPAAIIVSAIFASVFLLRVRRTRLFYGWLLLGVFASLCLAIPLGSSLEMAMILAGLLGTSVGIGTPVCFSYFAESTGVENRGKFGGIILLVTISTVPFVMLSIPTLGLVASAILLAAWRAWSLPLMLLAPKNSTLTRPTDVHVPSFTAVLRNRAFYLYFAAWFMFTLVDSFEAVVVSAPVEALGFYVRILEPIITGFSAIIAGAVSDWVGRKRVLIFGFVSLGIAYAIVGLFSQAWVSWLFYSVIDGIALGLLWVIFVIVLWGDLSGKGSERFYALGETPFFLTYIFSIILTPYVMSIPTTSSFSLAAFFLFVAVIPLLYAPETLPEKTMKDRELKQYLEKAQKVKEKYA
jgi:MFS family permease